MYTIFAVLLSASPMIYVAQVSTFGCNSRAEVSQLQAVRSDAKTFQQRLMTQVAYGQCVTIAQGAVVEGSTAHAESSTLLINAKKDPPGYVVPLQDFKRKDADAKQ